MRAYARHASLHKIGERFIERGESVRIMKPIRTRKTSARDRASIILLYSTGHWTMRDLADLFNITSGRVSQIVNDTYSEVGRIAHELNP